MQFLLQTSEEVSNAEPIDYVVNLPEIGGFEDSEPEDPHMASEEVERKGGGMFREKALSWNQFLSFDKEDSPNIGSLASNKI